MAEKRVLVAFYSRTGATRKVAQAIAGLLGADVEEIRDQKDRSGIVGYLGAGFDTMRGKPTALETEVHSPEDYDLVVIGTPVWAFTMSVPVRVYVERHRAALQRVAFFCTMGGSGDQKTFAAMEKHGGHAPVATLALKEGAVRKDAHLDKVREFVKQLQAQG